MSVRRWWGSEAAVAWGLALLATLSTVFRILLPDIVQYPFVLLTAVLLMAVLVLGSRALAVFVPYLMAMVVVVAAVGPTPPRLALTAVLVVLLCAVVLSYAVQDRPIGRTRRGETMLVDLRDRILAQGEIPALPGRWLVESALSSAGGSPFAGDFVVATTRRDGRRLELSVVDVSGKGEAAGTRALQLSGAMGGLLGALEPEQFLSAANEYLLQRAWEEGFATAVHLSLDLVTGEFELRGAGHPPPAQRHAGSGRWQVHETVGPVLGLLEDVEYDAVPGRLLPGDTLLLYTDGMVEEPRRDIELGIDAMLGEAESLLRSSWDGLAPRLVAAVGSPDDDRALLVVHRRH